MFSLILTFYIDIVLGSFQFLEQINKGVKQVTCFVSGWGESLFNKMSQSVVKPRWCLQPNGTTDNQWLALHQVFLDAKNNNVLIVKTLYYVN